MSTSVLALRMMAWRPTERPADVISAIWLSAIAPMFSGLTSTPIRTAFGASSLSRPNCFGISVVVTLLTPVRLPPGRLKLATRPALHGVAPGTEDDWNSRGRRLGRLCRGLAATGDNNRNLATNEIVDQLRQALVPTFRPSEFDRDVPPFDEACLTEALPKGGQHRSVGHRRSAVEISDHRHRLLRPCLQRPCRRAAEQREERAALDHSITSSARASSV